MKKNVALPPLIEQMINTYVDKKTPQHVKDNLYMTLSNINEAINDALKSQSLSRFK